MRIEVKTADSRTPAGEATCADVGGIGQPLSWSDPAGTEGVSSGGCLGLSPGDCLKPLRGVSCHHGRYEEEWNLVFGNNHRENLSSSASSPHTEESHAEMEQEMINVCREKGDKEKRRKSEFVGQG